MNISIVQLSKDDWQKYRDIRLLALKSDPDAFASSYDEEIALSEENWRNRINNMYFAICDEQIAGLVGLLKNDTLALKHCGHIVSLWVKPEMRGFGIAQMLMQKMQKIAPSLGLKKLILEVTTTKHAAISLYKKMGFREVGIQEKHLFKNGKYLDEFIMEYIIA